MEEKKVQTRILSLDVMRGLIMILLAAESCELYTALSSTYSSGWPKGIIHHFFHHEWHGLYFWDLVQPAFMFIAGTSLYLSFQRKQAAGVSWSSHFKSVAWRSAKLFLCGVALHCVYSGKLVWELWNVLTQLAFTTIIAYLIIRWSFLQQLLFSLFLLLLTDILYRFTTIPGYDQPFVLGKNFGTYIDMLVMGKDNDGGWVTINFIPTAAHTIWGVLTGKVLSRASNDVAKSKQLILASLSCLLIGYMLDWTLLSPIIKRISTPGFVFVSGGYILAILAFFRWLIDVKGYQSGAWIFVVVGMNPIFIYLFFETVGKQWFNGIVHLFVGGGLHLLGLSADPTAILVAIATLFCEWYLCYWLYQKRIFFKL
ncbi:acyltransferase family protein [Olivibacter jilunii]|uniref:acyltransferase family protein n=1 Tax=Olivibacter jilunii TaxID=985016 RepID=UPI003F14A6A6